MTIRRFATTLLAFPLCMALSAQAQATIDQPAADCPSYGECLDAVMLNARTAERAKELALMVRIHKLRVGYGAQAGGKQKRVGADSEAVGVDNADAALTSLLSDVNADFASKPEYQRVAALAYLKTNQPDSAIRILKQALQRTPSYTPFWLDLAKAYAAAGDKDRAVSALMVAHNWAHQPEVLVREYDKAAQGSGAMAEHFRAALPLIAARKEALARLDASVPPPTKADGPSQAGTLHRTELMKCKPEWPRTSLRYEETGKVTLSFIINEHGQVVQAKIGESSGHVALDHAALLGLASCVLPALKEGQPVATWTTLQYVWTLE